MLPVLALLGQIRGPRSLATGQARSLVHKALERYLLLVEHAHTLISFVLVLVHLDLSLAVVVPQHCDRVPCQETIFLTTPFGQWNRSSVLHRRQQRVRGVPAHLMPSSVNDNAGAAVVAKLTVRVDFACK